MKKFVFSLERMLHYKDSLLEEEKNRLAEIRARKNTVDQKIEDNEAQIAALNDERMEKAARGISILEMRGYNFSIDTTVKIIKELEVQQKILEKQVQEQLDRVLLQQREVSGLEKLKEKQLEEYRQEEQKEQALMVGELVSAKHIKQTTSPE